MTHKISYNKPAIYDTVAAKWNIPKWSEGRLVMVYGDTIHQSFTHPMDADLEVHELVHVRQHTAYPGGPEAWWQRYLDDAEFRIDQELEAYREQYQYTLANCNRQTRKAILDHCAKDLSSALYGNVMTKGRAKELIKQTS